MGKGAVVGNSTELKNVILFNDSKVPHFNYAGDSILGDYEVIGCGTVLNPGTIIGRNTNVYALSIVARAKTTKPFPNGLACKPVNLTIK